MAQLLAAVQAGKNDAVLGMLPSKVAQDARSSLVALQAALTNPDLTPFWETRDSERFKGAIGSGISAAFLFAGLAYLLIMFAAASYIARPPQGWMPARMKADVDAGKRKVIPDLTQMTANAAAKRAPFYGLWIMMFINISCGIGIIYTASPLAQESIGLTPAQAAGVVGLMSVFNGLGRLGWASFSDLPGPLQQLHPLLRASDRRLLVPAEHHQHHPVPGSALPDSHLLRRWVLDAAGLHRRSLRHQGTGCHSRLRAERVGHGRGLRPTDGRPPLPGHRHR